MRLCLGAYAVSMRSARSATPPPPFGALAQRASRAVPVPCPEVPPPPLYKLRPCPSYSRRRDRINLGPNFNSVPNVVQTHKTWVW